VNDELDAMLGKFSVEMVQKHYV